MFVPVRLVNADGVQGSLGKQVGGVRITLAACIGLDGHIAVPAIDTSDARLVAPNVGGVMVVGVRLIHEPEPMAKAFFERLTRSAFAAQIPFAEGNGFVLGVSL